MVLLPWNCHSNLVQKCLAIHCERNATSVEVERIFSKRQLLLSHVRNRLSAQTTHAVLCSSQWIVRGDICDTDILPIASLPEIDPKEGDSEREYDMGDNWDSIK